MPMSYTDLAQPEVIQNTIAALAKNGITAELVNTKEEAKSKVLSLIPAGAEIMTMTSITLEQSGIAEALNESGKYDSLKHKLMSMDRETQGAEMQKIGAAPTWAIGSVHAVTEDGKVVVVSNTGSQLPAYVYGSQHVIWVVSTKKIVKNLDIAFDRINAHIVPQETLRARQAYGLPDTFETFVSKSLVIHREVNPTRLHIILVNEDLGF